MTPPEEQKTEIEQEAIQYASLYWGRGSNSWGTAKAAYHDCATKYLQEIKGLREKNISLRTSEAHYRDLATRVQLEEIERLKAVNDSLVSAIKDATKQMYTLQDIEQAFQEGFNEGGTYHSLKASLEAYLANLKNKKEGISHD